MAIIGTLPNNLANGTTADASQVMADLNFIVNQTNANAQPAGNYMLANVTTLSLQQLTVKDAGNGQNTLTIDGSTDSSGANVKLIGDGATTPNKYLKATAGTFQVVNSEYTGVCIQSDDSGNFLAVGNITAQSDERFKKDWADLPPDFLEKLSLVKSGTFSRTDIEQRQAGVGAQSLKEVLPEAVQEVNERLTVAYGQAALVACVELAKEVMRLRALLEQAK
ncbi:tail fiber domain-containing protein [Paraburkholderia kururiensis]|uniref:tail fiber domain-containing protein n=1 Tax=Paraburkholderia kururiensis TaxID=984307 RepID=UPI00034B9ECE|nr:tail fiber domain-containing protein [Paraburkholderia kururiensis]